MQKKWLKIEKTLENEKLSLKKLDKMIARLEKNQDNSTQHEELFYIKNLS